MAHVCEANGEKMKLLVIFLFAVMVINLGIRLILLSTQQYPRKWIMTKGADAGAAFMYAAIALWCAWALWG